ncbi:NADH dehydrogenase (ubiquinone) [Stanieria cyanosphaera PCC 7437]|uniref:NADH:ubiquinone reductase (non-electrogenic) n=1 Tax=Stanieria cyanosphaera (strain ATCC 29371 / PCC 7437) TaxID=111780 RepID=K9XRZ3_STAC7|nr:NAD(P)/FAD-dependent oxidoreductase [Stanieria cyanosphaera]AFZ34854.1 NADH dehydrogenase (ubiquinone) [Stanieria cyanosphaera PCC 7437]
MFQEEKKQSLHHVVIVGGGFGGLYAAKSLAKAPVKVTLIDKQNFHVFQPLLYQVATGGLAPSNISSPLRAVLKHNKNTEVLMGEVTQIEPERQIVKLKYREIHYDSLIIATGASPQYFGNPEWVKKAPGLKTVEDALEIRRRIFLAFESAEKETIPEKRQDWLTFVLVGGGAAGVELAGALAELTRSTLKEDFRNIDPATAKIILIQSPERILPTYPAQLSEQALNKLKDLGVIVKTKTKVIDLNEQVVTVRQGEQIEQIRTRTVLWTAGMKASAIALRLSEATGASLDRMGRVIVSPEFTVGKYNNIFAIGDLAHYRINQNHLLPAVAPAAMQAGNYVANLIQSQLQGKKIASFRYWDWGNLAVIGKHAAVIDFGLIKLSGILAWLIWMFIHVFYLLEFDNKIIVAIQWVWSYFTSNKCDRLIVSSGISPKIELEPERDTQALLQV